MHRNPYLIFLGATLFDLILAIVILSLFATVYPDRFRTVLWQEGGTKGWNSDPHQRVYDYANYRKSPPIPLIWDESCTLCNLCIAIVTLFIWVVRFSIMSFSKQVLDFYATITINALYDVLLAGLWIYSACLQDLGDFSDPKHISLRPWYLERGCSEASLSTRYGCELMRCSYGLSVFAAFWFCLRFSSTCFYRAYVLGRKHELEDRKSSYSDLL
ncbi:hypothetical protein AG0111_0g1842 [Alternaria gaisen]|uniref:Uncharacterized protein n=1 Tax=Alternaria gaisen TaxID=167740 RepID=A0ACB6FYR0_9PLEO|nr:hypothetical protein AG0111_0g1842 [Alternaria gaisen]